MHQLRRRSAQKPHLDLIADRMPLEHRTALPFYELLVLIAKYKHPLINISGCLSYQIGVKVNLLFLSIYLIDEKER
jgi:hypothetical protein